MVLAKETGVKFKLSLINLEHSLLKNVDNMQQILGKIFKHRGDAELCTTYRKWYKAQRRLCV